mgnify:CR=1 FL=1
MSDDEKQQPAGDEPPESFEENLQRLDEAVKKLEEGNIPLDESLEVYEEGIKAFRSCRKMLEEAEGKISKLVETLEGELEEEPFEPPEQSG